MSGISGLSGAEDVREEGESSSHSLDKRDAQLSTEIKELLSSHDTNNGNSLKEEQPLDSEKDKGPKKSITSAKANAVNAVNQQVSLADFKRDMAEKYADFQNKTIGKNMTKQVKKQLADWVSQSKTPGSAFDDQVQISNLAKHAATKQRLTRPKRPPNTSSSTPLPHGQTAHMAADQNPQTKRQKQEASVRQTTRSSSEKPGSRALETYTVMFAKSLFKKDKKDSESLRDIRHSLKKDGVSEHELAGMEKGVRSFMGRTVKKQLKKTFLETLVYYDAEKMKKGKIGQAALNQFELFRNMVSNANKDGQSNEFELQTLREDVRDELRNFISQEFDRLLVEIRLKTTDINQLSTEMDRYNALIRNSQFHAPSYIKTLQKKLDSLGLQAFQIPYSLGLIDNDFQRNKKRRPPAEELFDGDTPDDAIRSLLYSLYTTPSLFKQIKIRYALHKHKKNLSDQEKKKWQRLEQQSRGLATLSLLSQLRRLFEERALLPECKGDTYKYLRSEIKRTLKQLKRLGKIIPRSERDQIRDEANRRVFSTVKETYLQVLVQLQADKESLYYKKESRNLYKTLMRLKDESKILESIEPELFNVNSLNKKQISEAA